MRKARWCLSAEVKEESAEKGGKVKRGGHGQYCRAGVSSRQGQCGLGVEAEAKTTAAG